MKLTNYEHYSPRRQRNLKRWDALAERGDPFLLALDRHHAALAPPDPATVASILGTAEGSPWAVTDLLRRWVFSAARLWGHPDSALFGRTDWLERLGALIDGAVDRMDTAGHWVAPGEADPNANRFALTSLLSALVDLHGQPAGAAVVDRHAAKLTAAVDFQREAYRPGSALHQKDYGAEGLRIVVLASDGETKIGTQRDWAVKKSRNIAAWPSLHCERELPAGASASEFAVWVGPWWAQPPERWALWTPGEGLCGWTADFGSTGAVGVAHNPTAESRELDFERLEGSWAASRWPGRSAPSRRPRKRA